MGVIMLTANISPTAAYYQIARVARPVAPIGLCQDAIPLRSLKKLQSLSHGHLAPQVDIGALAGIA
jgi:hypothetical protein